MNPNLSVAQFTSRHRSNLSSVLQSRFGFALLGCVLAWPFPPSARFWITDDGRRALRPGYRELSLDDWARLPA